MTDLPAPHDDATLNTLGSLDDIWPHDTDLTVSLGVARTAVAILSAYAAEELVHLPPAILPTHGTQTGRSLSFEFETEEQAQAFLDRLPIRPITT